MKRDPLVVEFVRQYREAHPKIFPGVAKMAAQGFMGFGRRDTDYGSHDLKRG